MRVRIGGVYNSDTIHYLLDKDVKHIKFDFRPRSFNFIQIKNVEEILQSSRSKDLETVSLCFDDLDPKISIEEIFRKVSDVYSKDKLMLDFYNANKTIEYYDSFNVPYNLEINSSFNYKNLSSYKYLKQLFIKNSHVEQMISFDKFLPFLNGILEERAIEDVELLLDWDEAISEVLTDFYNLKSFCLDINSKVESSYRQVDFNRLDDYFI